MLFNGFCATIDAGGYGSRLKAGTTRIIPATQSARGLHIIRPQGGRGECRVPSAPAASCAKRVVGMHTSIHSEFTGIIRHPHAMVYGLWRALPGDRAFLPPSPADQSTDLTPASGCQDHTFLPSAERAVRQERIRVHRIPAGVRDDRETPLSSGGTAAVLH